MQKILFMLLLFTVNYPINAQTNIADTNYTTRISLVKWMPDGKDMLLGIVMHHKTDDRAPFFSKVFLFDIKNRQLKTLFDDGSNLTVSPDGKTVAFLKRSEKKRSVIHFYNMDSKEVSILKPDTLAKFGLAWSPNGRYLTYNISGRNENQSDAVDICVLDLDTKETLQITRNEQVKSYNPEWSPDSKHILYYLEKGDGRDQVWLTDINGSYHRNLTNDTATHNYYPTWMNEKTILYTQSPVTLMMINADGSNRQKIEGINSTPVAYNATAGQIAYIKSEEENKLILFDWKKKTTSEILDGTKLVGLFLK